MANENNGAEGKPRDKTALSEETVEQIKSDIIFGGGYKRPPEDTRFRKGQSGNPKGRPRATTVGLGDSRSTNALVLQEAERLISIREGEEVRQVSAIEALLRAQYVLAIQGRSAYAQKHAIERYDRAERARRQKIANEIEYWERYVESRRRVIADALAKRETPPNILPHPDDVILDRENGVRFRGPTNEEEMERLQDTLRFRDILIMQDALDQRSIPAVESDDPLDQPGSAMSFAFYFNDNVPKRFKLSNTEISIHWTRFMGIPKRQLLKDLYRAWRKRGKPVPRGFTFPPLRYAKTIFDIMPELLHLMQKVAKEECEPHEFEERAVELLGQVRDSRVLKA